jgi:hypothetical protein
MMGSSLQRKKYSTLVLIEVLLWLSLAVLVVLLPNAFKVEAMAVLGLTSFFYLVVRKELPSVTVLGIWVAISVVTLIYLFVGIQNGAPDEAVSQVILIYIVSPLLWAISVRGALKSFGLRRIVIFFVVLTALAAASQAFYYYAFSTGKFSDFLVLMAGSPNLDYSENQVAAVMFVFGSMIFLYGGILSAPEVVRGGGSRSLIILIVLISTFTTGRSAVMLSAALGMIVYTLLSVRSTGAIRKSLAVNLIIVLIAGFVGSQYLSIRYGIDISIAITELLDKIGSGGGDGRQVYLPMLLYGAADYFFLGAGHGVGVEYAVSEEFPWRYEVVGAATLFRVGILGLLVYAAPFAFAVIEAYRAHVRGRLDPFERYLFGALVSGIFALNTNPYIEAVVFQWMFILPCTYFIDRQSLRRPELKVEK